MEIFTADTYLCDDLVNRVKSVVCKRCEVNVYNLNKHFVTEKEEEKAKSYDIQLIPAIVVDGELQDVGKLGQLLFDNKVNNSLGPIKRK